MHGIPLREGISVKIEGLLLDRNDLHSIAADLGIAPRDILFKDRVLTLYNTSELVSELIQNNSIVSFLAMTIDIAPETISEYQTVVEEPVKIEFDLSEFEDDDDD